MEENNVIYIVKIKLYGKVGMASSNASSITLQTSGVNVFGCVFKEWLFEYSIILFIYLVFKDKSAVQ